MEEVQNGPSNIHENVNIVLIYEEIKSLKQVTQHALQRLIQGIFQNFIRRDSHIQNNKPFKNV